MLTFKLPPCTNKHKADCFLIVREQSTKHILNELCQFKDIAGNLLATRYLVHVTDFDIETADPLTSYLDADVSVSLYKQLLSLNFSQSDKLQALLFSTQKINYYG